MDEGFLDVRWKMRSMGGKCTNVVGQKSLVRHNGCFSQDVKGLR